MTPHSPKTSSFFLGALFQEITKSVGGGGTVAPIAGPVGVAAGGSYIWGTETDGTSFVGLNTNVGASVGLKYGGHITYNEASFVQIITYQGEYVPKSFVVDEYFSELNCELRDKIQADFVKALPLVEDWEKAEDGTYLPMPGPQKDITKLEPTYPTYPDRSEPVKQAIIVPDLSFLDEPRAEIIPPDPQPGPPPKQDTTVIPIKPEQPVLTRPGANQNNTVTSDPQPGPPPTKDTTVIPIKPEQPVLTRPGANQNNENQNKVTPDPKPGPPPVPVPKSKPLPQPKPPKTSNTQIKDGKSIWQPRTKVQNGRKYVT